MNKVYRSIWNKALGTCVAVSERDRSRGKGKSGAADSVCDGRNDERGEGGASAPDCFIADDHPALEQQLFNVTQTQLKPEVPPNSAADDRHGKPMTVIKRFGILHQTILRVHPNTVTKPLLYIGILNDVRLTESTIRM